MLAVVSAIRVMMSVVAMVSAVAVMSVVTGVVSAMICVRSVDDDDLPPP